MKSSHLPIRSVGGGRESTVCHCECSGTHSEGDEACSSYAVCCDSDCFEEDGCINIPTGNCSSYCSNRCYDDGGGSCHVENVWCADDTDGSCDFTTIPECEDCLIDYGSSNESFCCDMAWYAYGLTCEHMENPSGAGWDCSGCNCPGDYHQPMCGPNGYDQKNPLCFKRRPHQPL